LNENISDNIGINISIGSNVGRRNPRRATCAEPTTITDPRDSLDIRDQLSTFLQLLRQDTSVLLENAKPIQRLFRQIRTHLTDELMASLTPAAFIELHYFKVQRAKKRIADRQANRQASAQLDSVKLKAKELKQEIDSLDASLSSDAQIIAEAQGRLNDYPIAIQEKKKELVHSINQMRCQHRQVNDIPGSDEEDLKLIADVG
uniref:Uncharacterized protein n=1 Tax=Setaria italica TaxID=4555 RepID=K4A253_SETIT